MYVRIGLSYILTTDIEIRSEYNARFLPRRHVAPHQYRRKPNLFPETAYYYKRLNSVSQP